MCPLVTAFPHGACFSRIFRQHQVVFFHKDAQQAECFLLGNRAVSRFLMSPDSFQANDMPSSVGRRRPGISSPFGAARFSWEAVAVFQRTSYYLTGQPAIEVSGRIAYNNQAEAQSRCLAHDVMSRAIFAPVRREFAGGRSYRSGPAFLILPAPFWTVPSWLKRNINHRLPAI